jgi:hypothetical protein
LTSATDREPVATARTAAVRTKCQRVFIGTRCKHCQLVRIKTELASTIAASVVIEKNYLPAATKKSLHDSSSGRNQVATTAW